MEKFLTDLIARKEELTRLHDLAIEDYDSGACDLHNVTYILGQIEEVGNTINKVNDLIFGV